MNGENILTIDSLKDTNSVLNCTTLKQVRKQMLDGKCPSQCKRCKLDAESGVQPRNEWETKRHESVFNYLDAIQTTNYQGEVISPKLISLDLRIGNLCNLRCVMCFPGESTPWYKDYKEITGHDEFIVDDKKYTLIKSEGDFDWSSDKEKIDLLINASKFLHKIKFGGGEPLMIKHHHYLLAELIAKGYAENIELEYSVNLTIFPPKLFDLWKHFRVVRICASIDAYGEANDAIRYPSKWETVEKNLRMLDNTDDNIIVFTSTTVSLLSLEHFATLQSWIENQNFKKINKTDENLAASHLVYHPEWLNINLLDDCKIFDEFRKTPCSKRTARKIDSYEQYWQDNKIMDANFKKKFAEVFPKLESKQSQDWEKLFPFAYSLYKQWL
jgi:organic radical activating enzyme